MKASSETHAVNRLSAKPLQPVSFKPSELHDPSSRFFLAGSEDVELRRLAEVARCRPVSRRRFHLERLSGNATAWAELGGAAFIFDTTLVPDIKNVIFGGDGLLVGRLTRPGKVWLQTLTMPNLAHSPAPYAGRETAASSTTVGAGVGGATGALGGAVVGALQVRCLAASCATTRHAADISYRSRAGSVTPRTPLRCNTPASG